MDIKNMNQSEFYSKKPTNMEMHAIGFSLDNLNSVDTLEELKLTPPNIVIADCVSSVRFLQNQFVEQELRKKYRYVMGLGIYIQLHYDTSANRKILKPSGIKFQNVYKPYNGQDLTNKTLLVFRTGGIGDLLFISPNLRFLKEKYPSCKIIFACGPQYQSMVNEWEFVDEVLDLPFTLNYLFNSDYHCVFEGVIERCKQAETTCSYHLFSKWMGLNLPNELLIPEQKPNEECLKKNKEVLNEFGIQEKDFIIVQMRASSPIRTPRPEVWIKLINLLTSRGHNILITDSSRQLKEVDRFISRVDNKEKVFNFSKYSKTISDTIAITSMAKLAISTDTALIHIAESLNVKSFGIFGPFPGLVRLLTYKNADWIDVWKECAPCFQHGIHLCKHSLSGFVSCYDNIDYDECIEKIDGLLVNV